MQAAIYARISSDQDGEALGVNRQLADCRAEADRRGWTVAEEYVDNDISAYSGKRRPAYEQLLEDIRAGRCDGLIVYRLDRLHRRPIELEEFVQVCDAAGMGHVATLSGDVNFGTGDGLLTARIMGAVAAQESHVKSERVRRKLQEVAENGKPHGGAARPFGYEPDKVTLRPAEAAIIRDVASRLLAGESIASLTRWLNAQGVPTVSGRGQWRTPTLRGVLMSARISGQRVHRGEIVGPAVWPAIITPAETAKIRALLTDPTRKTNRTARRYLLAGLLRCHACGETLRAHPRRGERRYVCKTGADFTGCGKTIISANPVERLITDAVLYRLSSPAMAAALTRADGHNDEQTQTLRQEITADRDQLKELATMYADRKITAAEWKPARDRIETRVKQAERRLGQLTNTNVLDGYIGNPDRLASEWSTLNLTRQAAIVKAVLDHAIVDKAKSAGGKFDPDRVRPTWRI